MACSQFPSLSRSCALCAAVLLADLLVAEENVDVHPEKDCRCWAVSGQCVNNPNFMQRKCRASCTWLRETEMCTQTVSQLRSNVSRLEIRLAHYHRMHRHAAKSAGFENAREAELIASQRLMSCEAAVKDLKEELNQKSDAKASVPSLTLRASELEIEVEQLSTKHKSCSDESHALRQRVEDLEAQVHQNSTVVEHAQHGHSQIAASALTEVEAERDSLKSELQSTRSASRALQTRIADLESRGDANKQRELEAKVAHLESQLSITTTTIDPLVEAARGEQNQLRSDHEQCKAAEREATVKTQTLESRIVDLSDQLSGKDIEVKSMADSSAAQLTELEQAKAEIASLKQKESALTLQLDRNLQTQLQNMACGSDNESTPAIEAGTAESHKSPKELNLRIIQLEAQVSHLKKVVNSTQVAEMASSSQSQAFEHRIFELEAQLAKMTQQEGNSTVGQDNWAELYDSLVNLPWTVKQRISNLPADTSWLAEETRLFMIEAVVTAINHTQHYVTTAVNHTQHYVIECAREAPAYLEDRAQSIRQNTINSAMFWKLRAAELLTELQRSSRELLSYALECLRQFYGEVERKVARAWADLMETLQRTWASMMVEYAHIKAHVVSQAQIVADDFRFKIVFAHLVCIANILCLLRLRRFLANAQLRAMSGATCKVAAG